MNITDAEDSNQPLGVGATVAALAALVACALALLDRAGRLGRRYGRART